MIREVKNIKGGDKSRKISKLTKYKFRNKKLSRALNKMKKFKVGILGATGMVGQKFISLLENHPWFEINILAASSKSAEKTFREAIKNKTNTENKISEKILNLKVFDVYKDAEKITENIDFAFCALNANKDDIKLLEETYAKIECPVISNNSANRMVSDIPMIIPEINAHHMEIIPYQKNRLKTKRGFIAVKSNCSIQCYVPALHPLFSNSISDILVCTYQAISGAGKNFETWPEMVDNIIPFISGEEEKSEQEPLKIWGKIKNGEIINNKDICITSQCFRVPVSDGHTAAVFAKFKNKISPEEAIQKIENFKCSQQSLGLPSSPKKFLHYFDENDRPQIKLDRNIENGMGISIGRLRKDSQYDIKFVCMSHNTIRGAAGGAILLAEMLCREGYIQ